MTKLLCKCEHVISDTTDDLPYKGEIVADADWEAVWGRISELGAAGIADFTDKISAIRLEHCRTAYECQNCGRLWVQKSPGSNTFVS